MPPASMHDNGSPDGLPFFVAPQQPVAAACRCNSQPQPPLLPDCKKE